MFIASFLLNYAFALSPHVVDVDLKSPKGETMGHVKMIEKRRGVQLRLELSKAQPGHQPISFYQNEKCQPPEYKVKEKAILEQVEVSKDGKGEKYIFLEGEQFTEKSLKTDKGLFLGVGNQVCVELFSPRR